MGALWLRLPEVPVTCSVLVPAGVVLLLLVDMLELPPAQAAHNVTSSASAAKAPGAENVLSFVGFSNVVASRPFRTSGLFPSTVTQTEVLERLPRPIFPVSRLP